ncbi:MAG: thymidylate synthase [Clostridia bacterium]|nr:thymidylate synthase [Clostridia bacterium]
MSRADKIYIDNINNILVNGCWDTDMDVRPRWADGSVAHSVKLFGIVNRYDLSEEFPILTIRRAPFKLPIDEMLWIWSKKSNDIKQLGSSVWNQWKDDNDTIGKAYGYQLGIKHDYPEGAFDQVDRLLYELKNNPYSRRMIANMFVHSDLNQMNLYPCAYSLTLNVSNGTLNGILNQRSQDMAVANNWNVVQYSVLMYMFAAVNGYRVGQLIHVIADAHIYDRHLEQIKRLITQPQFNAPTLLMDKLDNFYDYSTDNFRLNGYINSGFSPKFEVAI